MSHLLPLAGPTRSQRPRRLGRRLAGPALAIVVSGLALLPAPAQAVPTGGVTGGTSAWGISTYLNSANFGRPNPYVAGYVAPATFDATSRLSTWGSGTGAVQPNGSATLAFTGTSVNFTTTSGSFLKLADPQATLDAAGNGTLSAIVTYGTSPGSFPITYNDTSPARGPQRVTIVDLTGNTAADRTQTATTAKWTGLDGTWDAAFLTYLAGDSTASPAVAKFDFAAQVNNTVAGQGPAPFDLSVTTAVPVVTPTVTSTSYAGGLAVKLDGSGFRGVTNPGDAGIYVGIAPAGGLPDVSDMANMSTFAAVDWVAAAAITHGSFSRSLTAPTAKLDPAKTYVVYTWQAHTHSNPSQDTVTPLAIDWSRLVAPAVTKADSALKVKVRTKPAAGRKGTLSVAVSGGTTAPTGAVTLTLDRKGPFSTKHLTAALTAGGALVKLPRLPAGKWKVTVAYGGDATHTAASVTKTVKVKG